MKPWTSAMALIVAGAMLAGSAFAQTTTPSGEPKAKGGTAGAAGKSDTMKSGSMKDSATGASAGMAGKSQQVKAVQQALKDKGHDPGAVDGEMGPKTEAALRDYQQKEGLTATGNADAETMAKLTAAASPAASPAGGSATGTSKDAAPSGATQTK